MRDPNRLDNFYENLKKLHKENVPDWRFGQLISNFQSWYGNDIFYLEENQFMSKLNEFFRWDKRWKLMKYFFNLLNQKNNNNNQRNVSVLLRKDLDVNFSQERIKKNSHFMVYEFHERETCVCFVKYDDFYSFNTNGLNYSELQKLGFIIDLIVKAKYESYNNNISKNDIKALYNTASNALTDLLIEKLHTYMILLPNTKPSSIEYKNIKLIDFFGEKEIKNIGNSTSQLLTKISLMNKFNNFIFNDDIIVKIEI